MEKRGWDRPDFILVTGDAYVDHPSFGSAVISRVLESHGYRVAILAQPDWREISSFKIFGRPRLGFLVTGGNMDSMISNYTAAKKPRKKDVYSPGGVTGRRPDRASIVYCAAIRKAYKKMPIILGGLEASLRRLSHFDYWSGKLRRSILLDAKADLVIYGMGEKPVVEIAGLLDSGCSIREIRHVRGTLFRSDELPVNENILSLPSYKEVEASKKKFAESFKVQYDNTDPVTAKPLAESYEREWVIQNPPVIPLTSEEFDAVHALPYTREVHPSYAKEGKVAAIEEVQYSLISSRGCYGSCSFCALTFHQGRVVRSRGHESLISEAEEIIGHPGFKGYIHDVGGPTANFRHPACSRQLNKGVCKKRHCLAPDPCSQLEVDHSDYLSLLRKLRKLPGVKKVFVRSGIRFDYLMLDKDDTFFKELVEHHISGQLKVAPEHVSDRVLSYMGKPGNRVFKAFARKFQEINDSLGKKQFLVPYFISSHPGSTLEDAVMLAEYLRDSGLRSEQVQDFIPSPGTLSTAMYYSGYNPLTMKKTGVEKDLHYKALQRALLQYKKPQNRHLVEEALTLAGRKDLIGRGKKCLIPPGRESPPKGSQPQGSNNYKTQNKRVSENRSHTPQERRGRKSSLSASQTHGRKNSPGKRKKRSR